MHNSPERNAQIDQFFAELLDLPTSERSGRLREVEVDDPELVSEVASLLKAEATTERFRVEKVIEEAVSGSLLEELSTTLASATGPLSAGDRLGPYRVVEEIGRGGMSVVYRAERADDAFQGEVALKLLRWEGAGTETLQRFDQERQILADLTHPGIGRLLDGGIDEGRSFIVMELVDGLPIPEYCAQKRLGVAARLRLFLDVAEAVRFAHSNLVVHRDLKPSNILVTDDGTVKLLDFGIAKLLEPESPGSHAAPLTRTLTRLLTPEYASPEQIRGQTVTTASDVYQLGLLLYELLAGIKPHDIPATATFSRIEEIICNQPPNAPSAMLGSDSSGDTIARLVDGSSVTALKRRLRGDLDTIVLRALAKEPQRRYRSVESLIEDIRRHLDGRAVLARGDALAYRAGRFIARHRWGVAAAVALTSILVAYAVTVSIQSRTIAHERDRARNEAVKTGEVKDYLVELFEVSDPWASSGIDVTAKELLERGASRIETALEAQPDVQAELMSTLGGIYVRLGAYEQATPLLEQAVALQRGLGGETPDDGVGLGNALYELGQLRRDEGDLEAARPLLEESLTLRRTAWGEPSAQVAESLEALGSLAGADGDLDSAETLHRQALDMRRATLGAHHPDLAVSLDALARVRRQRGDYAEARTLLDEALTIRRAVLNPSHPDLSGNMASLALIHRLEGDYQSAAELLREALARRREVLGEDHPYVAITMSNLAEALRGLGEPESAETVLREALAVREKSLGATHPMVAANYNDLGRALADQGRLDEAEAAYREALDRFDAGHRWRSYAEFNLGRVFEQRGEIGRAREIYQRIVDQDRAERGMDHPLTAQRSVRLAAVLALDGQEAQAIELLETALPVLREKSPKHPATEEAEGLLETLRDS